jgi:WD40 repeat protein
MGPSCDACYDLAQEGQTPAPAWLAPARATLQGEEGRLVFLAYSPDSRVLAACTARHEVTLWDMASGLERGKLTGKPDEWLLGVAWIDGGQRLVTADVGGRLRFWSGRTGLPTGYEVRTSAAESFAASPDGELFARGDRHKVHVFHGHEGRPLLHLDGDMNGIGCLAFSPDGRLIAAGCRQGAVAVWDAQTGQPRGRFERHGALITGLAFSPHAQTLAIALHPASGSSAAENGRIVLWDVTAAEPRATLPGHEGGTRAVAFAPDGRVLASGGEDGLVRLWEVHSGQERVALEWHLDSVCSVAFAPDGLTLATGSFDGTVKLWPRELLRPLTRTRQRMAP